MSKKNLYLHSFSLYDTSNLYSRFSDLLASFILRSYTLLISILLQFSQCYRALNSRYRSSSIILYFAHLISFTAPHSLVSFYLCSINFSRLYICNSRVVNDVLQVLSIYKHILLRANSVCLYYPRNGKFYLDFQKACKFLTRNASSIVWPCDLSLVYMPTSHNAI